MNVVPTAHTRRIAQRMADDAAKDDDNSAFDVTIEWLHRVDSEQLPALVGLLLEKLPTAAKTEEVAATFDEAQRLEARRRFRAGERDDPWVIAGNREYHRVTVQRNRDKQKSRDTGETGYDEAQRREAHRRYAAGDRSEWVKEGEREYYRVNRKLNRDREKRALAVVRNEAS